MSQKPELSVVICACNRAPKLAHALELYKQQTLDRARFEMVLVNDGSTDNTGEVMRSALKDLPGTYVEHNRNRGLSAAKNSAIGAARGDYVVFVNDDTYPNLDYCQKVLDFMLAHVGTKTVGLSYLPFTDELMSRVFYHSMFYHNLYTPFVGMEEGKDYPFDHFIGTGTCFPRKAFLEEQIWFDEGYVTYGAEDMDCGYRLYNRGYRVRYNPQAVMLHDHEMTLRDYRERCKKIGRNLIALCSKHPVLRQHYFKFSRITEREIEGWRRFIADNGDRVEKLTDDVESIKDFPLAFGDAEEKALLENLIGSIGSAMHIMFTYETNRGFVETLDADPEARKILAGPELAWTEQPAGSKSADRDSGFVSNCADSSAGSSSPCTITDSLLARAEEDIEAGRFSEAKEKLSKILLSVPGDKRAVNDLAVIAILENNMNEADSLFAALERSRPDDGSIRENIRCYHALKAAEQR